MTNDDTIPDDVRTPEFRELVRTYSRADLYADRILSQKLHPTQAAVLQDLFRTKSRVSFRCSNEVGKTSRVASTAVLYALDVLNAQVISTAGVWMQVVAQLVPQLKKHQHLFSKWSFNESDITINGVKRYVGFSTRDEGFAQGFHKDDGRPLVAIIDEAAAVKDVIFDGIEDRCNPDHLLIMGSPLDPIGRFYDIETKLSRFYTHHHLAQPDCLTTAGWWIDPATVERKIEKYGSKEHPFIQSNVFGEFASKVANGLLSLAEFNNCLNNPPDWHPGINNRHAFVDVGVTNCFAMRHGNKVWVEKIWVNDNIIGICGEIIRVASKLKRDTGLRMTEITIDGPGDYGKQVGDELHKMGWTVNRFYGQSKECDDADYFNRTSETWIGGCATIKAGDVILPDNDNFRSQCLSRLQRVGAGGKFQVEPKDEYIKRGFESPHEGDSILGAMLPLRHSASVNLITSSKEDHRGWRERAEDERGYSEQSGDLPSEACL